MCFSIFSNLIDRPSHWICHLISCPVFPTALFFHFYNYFVHSFLLLFFHCCFLNIFISFFYVLFPLSFLLFIFVFLIFVFSFLSCFWYEERVCTLCVCHFTEWYEAYVHAERVLVACEANKAEDAQYVKTYTAWLWVSAVNSLGFFRTKPFTFVSMDDEFSFMHYMVSM